MPAFWWSHAVQGRNTYSILAHLNAYLWLYDKGLPSPSVRAVFPLPWQRNSQHAEQPPRWLCLLCSSWEALNQDALTSSLCTASLNFYRVKRVLFKGCSFTVTKPENGEEQQLLCILCVLDRSYSLCPWITILAITPGGLWKHCSSWRAFFMIQGQTQRIPTVLILRYKIRELRQCWTHSYKLQILCSFLSYDLYSSCRSFFPVQEMQVWGIQAGLFQILYSGLVGEYFRKSFRATKIPLVL